MSTVSTFVNKVNLLRCNDLMPFVDVVDSVDSVFEKNLVFLCVETLKSADFRVNSVNTVNNMG